MTRAAEIELETAAALAQGTRARQEDALATAFARGGEVGFAVLSDGMGGHAAGDLASRIIVTEIFAELTLRLARPGLDPAAIPALLRDAVTVANRCLRDRIAVEPETRGMGGTVIVIAVAGNGLYWISVGDSPLYLYRGGRLVRLNDDHSMAPQIDLMARQGMIDAETARTHPQRNCLTSALIGAEIPEVDCPDEAFALEPGDLVLAASDGLQFLPDAAIGGILKRARRRSTGRIAEALIAGVERLADPDQDNVSLVVLKAGADPRRGRSPVRRQLAGLLGLWSGDLAPARAAVARDG